MGTSELQKTRHTVKHCFIREIFIFRVNLRTHGDVKNKVLANYITYKDCRKREGQMAKIKSREYFQDSCLMKKAMRKIGSLQH